jgi:cytochrome oxidase assembly protein ShyY1
MTDQPPPDENRNESEDERRRANILLLVFFAVVVGIGVWLVNALVDARRADECIAQRRTNCNPIDVPPREVPPG